MSQETPSSNVQRTKWAIAVVVLLLGYAVAQPFLNRQLGLNLPSLASLLGEEDNARNNEEKRKTPDEQTSLRDDSSSQSPSQLDDASLKYGYLKEVSSDNYLSPAGLRYTPGSEEGHRLKHLARHLEDQPSRENTHGVFYGDMPQVLRWLDDTYERAEAGEKGTSKRSDRGRVVYEAGFDKPIGFVGGKPGKRKGNPEARRIRLVTDDRRVITAFPYQ